MADMEIDGATASQKAPLVSLEILKTIRSAQQQHGLRHGDYGRYRQYCTKRLRRLRKSTKFLHGRGRFVKKTLEPEAIVDARILAIPLLNAERAWAMAMEIKGQLSMGPVAPKRAHLQARLWKAAGWAEQLAHLASERADHRTSVEAEAYAAWINGTALLEKQSDWDSALGALVRAKQLCEGLAAVGSADFQAAAHAQAAEAEPGIRFCTYKLGGNARDIQQPSSFTATADVATAKLAALTKGREPSGKGGANSTDSFEWHGVSYALPSQAARDAISSAVQLTTLMDAPHVDGAGNAAAGSVDSNSTRKLPLLEKVASAYAAARSAASEASAADIDQRKADWDSLETAARGAALETSLQRTRLLAAAADARLSRTLAASLQSQAAPRPKDKVRAGRPEEVVRLYDTLAALIFELTDVATSMGGVAGEALLDSSAAQAAACQAGRCYYTAHTHMAGSKVAVAHALFDRTVHLCTVAIARQKDCDPVDQGEVASLQALSLKAAAFKVASHAAAVASERRLAGSVEQMSLTEGQAGSDPVAYMVDALTACRSFAGGHGSEPRIAPIIPAPRAIPVRPIVLDIAQDYVSEPDLTHRLEKAPAAKSLGSRLFGWK